MDSAQSQNGEGQKPAFTGDKAATRQLLSMANVGNVSTESNLTINKPLETTDALSAENEEFLNLVVQKVDSGEINVHTPKSMMNLPVYEKLTETEQDKIDIYAVNMLSTIRRIQNLCLIDQKYTYQMQNLLEEFRLRKEETEKTFGDVFII